MKSYTIRILLFTLYFVKIDSVDPALEDEEITAISYIKYLNERASERHKRYSAAEWAYASNITEYNLKEKVSIFSE